MVISETNFCISHFCSHPDPFLHDTVLLSQASQFPSLLFYTDFNLDIHLMCSPLWLTMIYRDHAVSFSWRLKSSYPKEDPYNFFCPILIDKAEEADQAFYHIRGGVLMAQSQWTSAFRNSFDSDLQAFIKVMCVLWPIHKQLDECFHFLACYPT